MKPRFKLFLGIFLCSFALYGCFRAEAPDAFRIDRETEILAPQIPHIRLSPPPIKYSYQPALSVQKFIDSRPSFALTDFDRKTRIAAKSSPTFIVTDAAKKIFIALGYKVQTRSPILLKGAIQKWIVVDREEKDARKAMAQIFIRVTSPAGQAFFEKTYKSAINISRDEDSDTFLRAKLGEVMALTLKKMGEDPDLLNTIASF